jgi:uncharacterized protein (DUF433 family)
MYNYLYPYSINLFIKKENKMRKIVINTEICHGKAHIEGTRIPVHIILQLLAAGETHQNILNAYSQIAEDDIRACVNYAAKLATEEVVYESEAALG